MFNAGLRMSLICWALGPLSASPSRMPGPTRQVPRPIIGSRALDKQTRKVIAGLGAQGDGNILLVTCNDTSGYASIQSAIDAAQDGDTVIALPRNAFGLDCDGDAYTENINFSGKAITVRSLFPTKPDYVKATVIDGRQTDSVVRFQQDEGPDSIIEGFTIRNGRSFDGGGIACDHSSPTIRHCVVTNNLSFTYGGGISCTSSAAAITDCRIISNTGNIGAGGIYTAHGEGVSVHHCTIEENSTPQYGGGIFGDGTFSNCIIARNSAGFYGGGVYTFNGTVVNSLIVDNTSGVSGGGIMLVNGTARVGNCTVVGNSAPESGGGLHAVASGVDSEIRNSIVWGNSAKNGSALSIQNHTTILVDYSAVAGGAGEVFYDDSSGFDWRCGNINLDPGFTDPANGDYRLNLRSLARNGGDPDVEAIGHETDLDGNRRIAEGRIDMGAYEFVP